MVYFTEVEIYVEPQKILNSHSNLEKNRVGGIILHDIKL